ncbi:MAG TPA: MFS transporter [Caulobacter sp.]|nr:MFS transporter [Caulobacter sp.]
MPQTSLSERPSSIGLIKLTTFLMFMMFAMTTDAVGVIIPQIIKTFGLDLTAAGAFHYATMSGIALGGLCLGFLADRIGRKATIILGLVGFATAALGFAIAERFAVFVTLLFVSGVAIGVFKTGALALIGDISASTRAHTANMNMVEGFFGVGAIIGPAIVAALLAAGASWKWLYVIAGGLCAALIIAALMVRHPQTPRAAQESLDPRATLAMFTNPYALAFGFAIMLYAGVETAIYVWMPTLLAGYQGPARLLAVYALSIFFVLRAIGRFLGAWMLSRLAWALVVALCSAAIFLCFGATLAGGRDVAVYTLPLSGLFMSVLYPTINSKGISCFPKAEHGSASGVILFFTCISAVASPWAMGVVSDRFGDAAYGFRLATGLAALLAILGGCNLIFDPTRRRLKARQDADYVTGHRSEED